MSNRQIARAVGSIQTTGAKIGTKVGSSWCSALLQVVPEVGKGFVDAYVEYKKAEFRMREIESNYQIRSMELQNQRFEIEGRVRQELRRLDTERCDANHYYQMAKKSLKSLCMSRDKLLHQSDWLLKRALKSRSSMEAEMLLGVYTTVCGLIDGKDERIGDFGASYRRIGCGKTDE